MLRVMFIVTFLLVGIVGMKPNVHIPNEVASVDSVVIPVTPDTTELEKFLHHIGLRESNNKLTVVNQFGMLGKYQFSPTTLKHFLGDTVTRQQFLRSAELQDSIMVRYMRDNNSRLQDLISRHDGTTFKGIRITRSGILAAAHLAGPGGVRHFFATNDTHGRRDANGTSVRDYLRLFSGYNLGEVF
jgi:hypothetical protein